MTLEVVSYSLTGLGSLVEIRNAHELAISSELPSIVVVMDTSGSMGHYVGIVLSDCIPTAMRNAGYDLATTRVKVITFASHSRRMLVDNDKYPTGRDLQNTLFMGEGTTHMCGVFELLEPELRCSKNVTLFGISDGEISDVSDTLRMAQQAQHDCTAYIEVAMVRLVTSRDGNPDTRALACLGQFGTNGTNSIHDIIANSTENDASWRQQLIELLVVHLQPRQLIEVKYPNLRRTPSDVPSPALQLCRLNQENKMNENGTLVFLASSKMDSICINDTMYPVQEEKNFSPPAMQFFCDYASTKLQLQNILGFNIDAMKLWFTRFAAHEDDNEINNAMPNPKQRMRRFKQKMAAGLRGAINEVLAHANEGRLLALNQTQQQAADYLRQSTSKALAKRNLKNTAQQQARGETATVNHQVATMMREFQTHVAAEEAELPQEASFFSMYSNYDAFMCLMEEMQDQNLQLDDMSTVDILRIVGLLGVCYHHTPRDVEDPYIFNVAQLFGGVYLNMSDLREVNSQKIGGVTAELKAPGTDITITGVVPLRCLSPALFDLFWKHGMKLLEAHCTLNMRRMLAQVRSDLLGERMAVLMCIMHKYSSTTATAKGKFSTWDKLVFDDIRMQLSMLLEMAPHKQEFERLVDHIRQQTSFRHLLTGESCVSCIQKPLIALLCYAKPENTAYIGNMLEILFEFQAYHRARHHFEDLEQRQQTLARVLQIHAEDTIVWFPVRNLEDIPEEQDGVYRNQLIATKVQELLDTTTLWHVNEQAVIDTANDDADLLRWMPIRADYATYFRILTGCDDSQFEIAPRPFFMALVAACVAHEEKVRVKNEQHQLFEWGNAKSEFDFLQASTRVFYADFLQNKITLEMVRRDNAHLITQIHIMCHPDTDVEDFKTQLQREIPNRDHPGYKLLLDQLLSRVNQVEFAEKLAILISGRTFNNDVCFAQGNFDTNFFKYQTFFDAKDWTTLLNLKAQFGIWQYRSSNLPNRLGYSNNNPSDWAVNIYPKTT